jgi:hypothetical protein
MTPTPRLQAANISEKPVDLWIGQGGSGFVKDEQTTVLGQGSGDFNELLLTYAEQTRGSR